MKLIPIATLIGAAVGSEIKSQKFCVNSKPWGHAWFGKMKDPSFSAHAEFVENALANQNNNSIDSICADAASSCAQYDDIDNTDDYGQKIQIWRQKNGGRKCGAQANKAILNKLVCQMCQLATDDDAAAAAEAQIEDEAVSGQRAVSGETPFAGFLTSTLVKNFDDAASEKLAAEEEADVPEGQRSVPTNSKCANGGACKLKWDIKKHFKTMTRDMWNIVYSGGPEYCTDMMPRYPKVNFGQMNPKNPNWHSVVSIRDNCVALQQLVQKVKCACLYIIWGSRSYPKPSDKRFRLAHGKQESHMCWYFSQLKGTGLWRPQKKPTSTECAAKSKPKGPAVQAYVTLTSCRQLRNKKQKKNCFKKLKRQGNTGGH